MNYLYANPPENAVDVIPLISYWITQLKSKNETLHLPEAIQTLIANIRANGNIKLTLSQLDLILNDFDTEEETYDVMLELYNTLKIFMTDHHLHCFIDQEEIHDSGPLSKIFVSFGHTKHNLTHRFEVKYALSHADLSQPLTLKLAPHLSLADVSDLFKNAIASQLIIHPMILFLSGEHYHQLKERKKIRHQLQTLIQDENWSFLTHVFLVPDHRSPLYGPNFRPDHYLFSDEIEGYQTLSKSQHLAAYYLSDASIFNTINLRRIEKKTLMSPSAQSQQRPLHQNTRYIIRSTPPGPHHRTSKKSDLHEAKKTLSLTHNFSINIEQEQHQTQQQQQENEQTQTQQQNFSRSMDRHHGWTFYPSTLSFNTFARLLREYASKKIQDAPYVATEHFHQTNVFEQLSKTNNFFAEHITGIIFGRCYLCPEFSGLQHGSFTSIEYALGFELINHILHFLDGLSLKDNQIDRYSLTLRIKSYPAIGYIIPFLESNILTHYAKPASLNTDVFFRHDALLSEATLFNYTVLEQSFLQTKDFEALSTEHQTDWKNSLPILLGIFNPGQPNHTFTQESLKVAILKLYQFLSPESNQALLEHLLNSFETFHPDHARSLLWPIVTSYRQSSHSLFHLLSLLEERNLLIYFKQIYIEYALSFTDLSNLLDQNEHCPIPHAFLFELIQIIPPTESPLAPPLFAKFALSFTRYTRRWGISIDSISLDDLKVFWERISLKIRQYHQNDLKNTEHTLEILLKHLCCEKNGFVVQRVYLIQTLLTGLESIIDASIKNNTLLEQIQEWENLSLLETSLYALTYDRFKIITKEMSITIETLHFDDPWMVYAYYPLVQPTPSFYQITPSFLKFFLCQQVLHDDPNNTRYKKLKTLLFRYLGTESLREPIHFYRQLFENNQHHPDPINTYFSHLLLAFWILTKTGDHYTREVNPIALSQDFFIFLLEKKHIRIENEHHTNELMYDKIKKDYAPMIHECVLNFCTQIQNLFSNLSSHDSYTLSFFYTLEEAPQDPALFFKALIDYCLTRSPMEQLPAIFKAPFSLSNSAAFFKIHQKELEQEEVWFRSQPSLLEKLIQKKIEIAFTTERQHDALQTALFLKSIIPLGSIKSLIEQCSNIEKLIQKINTFGIQKSHQAWIPDYFNLILSHQSLLTALLLLDLLSQAPNNEKLPLIFKSFLLKLTQYPEILTSEEHREPLLSLLWTTSLQYPASPYLNSLCPFLIRLLPLDPKKAEKTSKILLSFIPWKTKTISSSFFFLYEPLSLDQLEQLASLLEDRSFDLKILLHLFEKNPSIDFYSTLNPYKTLDKEHQNILFHLADFICTSDIPFEILLSHCAKHPKRDLIHLHRLIKLHHLSPQTIFPILQQPILKQEIKTLERDLYHKNLDRFNYDLTTVVDHISKIEKKSTRKNEPNHPLSPLEKESLLHDYQTMMSYFKDKPILNQLPIHELDFEQCAFLYQELSKQLKKTSLTQQQKHAYRLPLLALLSEALYRTYLKFPRDTQHLCLLFLLNHPEPLIEEAKTGSGKSILAQITASLLCAEGYTIHMATENTELAKVGLSNFIFLYEYLNIPHAKEIITPYLSYQQYCPNGINHSTPAYFAFFQTLMLLRKKTLPKNTALLCDEIDSVLTTTVQYRLAGVIDPLYLDKKAWAFVFIKLIHFVQEKELYLDNTCDDHEDIENFKLYVSAQAIEQHHIHFVQNIPNAILQPLLDVARIPEILIEGEDYLPIEQFDDHQYGRYAAPIINIGTKRPDPALRLGAVQPLLHAKKNDSDPTKIPFFEEIITETLVTISAKNFFDTYPKIIGWTGTPGSEVELDEFNTENRLTAYYFPSFYPDRTTHLNTILTDTRAEHLEYLVSTLLQQQERSLERPILIFMDSPKKLQDCETFLKTKSYPFNLQFYNGYEDESCAEKNIIQKAGSPGKITLTTLSLSRGTDFSTDHPLGFFAINTATDISESEYIQIKGRIGRNGACGEFLSLICKEDLNTALSLSSEAEECFKAHRQFITETRQKNRLKTRLLETSRAYVINQYFFKLRQTAEDILEQQCGLYHTLMSEKNFLKTLRDFNEQSEKIYNQLIGQESKLDLAQRALFFQKLVEMYQVMIEDLLPNQNLKHLNIIEPFIALRELPHIPLANDLPIGNLFTLSTLSADLWKVIGHQKMVLFCEATDELLASFQDYFDGKKSLTATFAIVLQQRDLLNIPDILQEIDHTKQLITDFNFQEEMTTATTELDTNEHTQSWGVGQMIRQLLDDTILSHMKTFVIDYLNDIRSKINAERWDELSLPNFQSEWIQSWIQRIQNIQTTLTWIHYGSMIAGGPVSFILKYYIVPTLFKIIKNLIKEWFKNSESELAQILIGLDDIQDQFAEVLTLLFNKDLKKLSVDEFIQHLLPLFQNKAIQLLLKKIDSSDDFNVLFDLIPDLMVALEPLKELPLSELKRPEHLIPILIQLLQSDLLKQFIREEEHAFLLERLSALPPDFSLYFEACNLPQLFSVIKIFGHPKFNECLLQLPAETHFSELVRWVNTEPSLLPESVQEPFNVLYEYQNNHDRVQQQTQLTYTRVKERFTLSVFDLERHHELLSKQYQPLQSQTPEPSPPSFSWTSCICQHIIIPYALLLLVNFFFLQLSILYLSIVFLGVVATSVIHHVYHSQTFWNSSDEPSLLSVQEPSFIMPST